MKQYQLYGIGAALVDTEITLDDADLIQMAVAKGVMTLVDEKRQSQLIEYLQDHLVASHKASGGSAANSIIAASYFGCKSVYSCKVANDDNGHFYLQDLKNAGVITPKHIQPPEGITGKCLVMITPDAERTMNTFLGISETISIEELDPDAIAKSEMAYIEGYLVTSPTGKAAAIELARIAKANHTKIALSLSDPAMVQFFREGLLEMIGDGVDLIFCNRDEALGFTQTHHIEDACRELKKYCKQFAITCGGEGALVFDGKEQIQVPGSPVNAVDTNGAGDMFAGAFLYALSAKHNFEVAAKFANLSAAKVVSQFGPRLKAEEYLTLKNQFFA